MIIIIESPNKVKKYKAVLINAKVLATVGHFKDLPKDQIGISFPTYDPTFIPLDERQKNVVSRLKSVCRGEDCIVATDPDREGYAIACMVVEEIQGVSKSIQRAEVREMTERGIKAAIDSAIPFANSNTATYHSFLGRRISDRLIGYILSPAATKSLTLPQSVGRVQSPALRLVVEREQEIREFTSSPYWIIAIDLHKDDMSFRAFWAQGKMTDPQQASRVLASLTADKSAVCVGVENQQKKWNSKPPFTTVKLQAAASANLQYSPDHTMKLAQGLFEAGLITYHRTDSTVLSEEFITAAWSYIKDRHGAQYLPASPIRHISKNSQAEAHEAIRPTATVLHSLANCQKIVLTEGLTVEHAKLYELIFRRAVASQGAPAVYEETKARFRCCGEVFKARGRITSFPGWVDIYGAATGTDSEDNASDEEKDEGYQKLPVLTKGELIAKLGEEAEAKMTRAPSRYS